MKCCIVKDLLSNYIDGLCNEETNEEIRKHLDDCDDCRAVYEKMSAASLWEMPTEDKNIDFFGKLKVKMLRRNIVIAVSAFIMVSGAFFIFAKSYRIPIDFDPNYMSVEEYTAAIITTNGYTSLRNVDHFKDMIPEDCENLMNAVKLVYNGINNISMDRIGRSVNRDGKTVKVYYYCYEESLWDLLFADPEPRTGGSYVPLNNNGNRADYEPQVREIYYLPVKHLSGFEKLSDEEYDRMREKGTLIWSGIS